MGKNMPVEMVVIAIIDSNRFPSAYCLMQGRCFTCKKKPKNIYLKIGITTFNKMLILQR